MRINSALGDVGMEIAESTVLLSTLLYLTHSFGIACYSSLDKFILRDNERLQ